MILPTQEHGLSLHLFMSSFISFISVIVFCAQFFCYLHFSQFSRSVVSNSLRSHESQHARPPCPSPTPGVYRNSCASNRWCHPAISSFVVPFSSYLQSLSASESTLCMRWPEYWSFSFSIIPSKEIWSPSEWNCWISLQSKGLSGVFSNTTVQKHQFFSAQLSSQSNSDIHTWPQEKPQPWLDGPLLAK